MTTPLEIAKRYEGHTPGPWTAQVVTEYEDGEAHPAVAPINSEGVICRFIGTSFIPEVEAANAALVAAAPDLLYDNERLIARVTQLEQALEFCKGEAYRALAGINGLPEALEQIEVHARAGLAHDKEEG